MLRQPHSTRRLFGVVDYSKLSNWLKLRYSAKFTDKLALETGLDIAPFRGFSVQPGWALHYEVSASSLSIQCVEGKPMVWTGAWPCRTTSLQR